MCFIRACVSHGQVTAWAGPPRCCAIHQAYGDTGRAGRRFPRWGAQVPPGRAPVRDSPPARVKQQFYSETPASAGGVCFRLHLCQPGRSTSTNRPSSPRSSKNARSSGSWRAGHARRIGARAERGGCLAAARPQLPEFGQVYVVDVHGCALPTSAIRALPECIRCLCSGSALEVDTRRSRTGRREPSDDPAADSRGASARR